MVIWYIFPYFGMLYQVKSGNPVGEPWRPCHIFFQIFVGKKVLQKFHPKFGKTIKTSSPSSLRRLAQFNQGDQIGRIFVYWAIVFFFFVAKTFPIQPSHKGLAIQADVAFCFMPGA
jgi:hypothetical protein